MDIWMCETTKSAQKKLSPGSLYKVGYICMLFISSHILYYIIAQLLYAKCEKYKDYNFIIIFCKVALKLCIVKEPYTNKVDLLKWE